MLQADVKLHWQVHTDVGYGHDARSIQIPVSELYLYR